MPKLGRIVAVAISAWVVGCGSPPRAGDRSSLADPIQTAVETEMAGELFEDATRQTGLDFVHWNGMSGQYYFAEVMGAGGALFDYDRDGDLDLYLIQGTMLEPGKTAADSTFPPPAGRPLTDRLYRNDLGRGDDGSSIVTLVDVSADAGLAVRGYGMGVAAGDYDNDGWVDLYITSYGPNRLLHNQGDGTFRDVTEASGTQDQRWSVPAVFFDYDRDGWLDLYVGNYVDFQVATHFACFSDLGERDYCGPLSYRPLSDRLFRNRGDGTFEDRSGRAGLSSEVGGALGAAIGDFDRDGWLDLYVGNDAMPNQLWMNQRDGSFRNQALLAGCAVNDAGNPEASMGIAIADYDLDGDEDLLMTHLSGETNTLYQNLGDGLFEDRSASSGIAAPSLPWTGFGAVWHDFDHDGRRDLLVANGAVTVIPELLLAGDSYPLRQRNALFVGEAAGRYRLLEPSGALAASEVSRSAIAGDLDNDGDLDVVITNNSGPAQLLIRRGAPMGPWIGLKMVGGPGPRDVLGTWVEVVLEDGRVLGERVRSAYGYASANDPRVLLPLPPDAPDVGVRELRAIWADGVSEIWSPPKLGGYSVVRQGTGTASGNSGGEGVGGRGSGDQGGRVGRPPPSP